MKTFIFSCVGMALTIGVYKSMAPSASANARQCDTAATYTAEKMYTCGMLRSYEAVSRIKNDLANNFVKRQVSDSECATNVYMMQQQTCQDFEMMINSLGK